MYRKRNGKVSDSKWPSQEWLEWNDMYSQISLCIYISCRVFPGLFTLKTDHRKYPRKVLIVLWVSRRWGISMTLGLRWGNVWLLFRRELKRQFWMIYLFGKPIAYYYSITCWLHSSKCRRFVFFIVSFFMVFGDNRSSLTFTNFHLECFLGGSVYFLFLLLSNFTNSENILT